MSDVSAVAVIVAFFAFSLALFWRGEKPRGGPR